MAASYEYVASGMNFTNLHTAHVLENPDMKAEGARMLSKLHANNHSFSMLYNAHIEKTFGEKFRKYDKGTFKSIYADSGGLQVVTQGLEITQQLKNDVYVNQGTWADLGMCFDEIPLSFTGGKSSRLDLSNRWFDKEQFEKCAIATGVNVNDQINAFRSMNSKCKPVIIMQGNCYDTYMKWAELVYSKISKENIPYVGGIAMGAAALGHGALEDIQRAVYYKMLPIELPSPHMHLLAVGSVKRLIPNIIFSQNGFYDDIHLSYDSTTHTSSPYMGRYTSKKGNMVLSRNKNKNHAIILKDIQEIYPEYDVSVDDYFKFVTTNLTKCIEEHKDKGVGYLRAYAYSICASIYRFTERANEVITDLSKMELHLDRKEIPPYTALLSVKTYDDYKAWERNFKKRVPSHAVQSDAPLSLESFF